MEISCAFATSMETPHHIELAEQLGYRRAWCYDSPALYADVWMVLGLAAARTTTIGLGPGVLIPSLRHPIDTAASIATLAQLAPGRTVVGIGSGFTGRVSLGQKPMRWSEVRHYVEVLRALLNGETSDWDGARIRLMQPRSCGATRPVDVAILIGANGPKGATAAADLGDGIFSDTVSVLEQADHDWRALLMWGSVLDPGESATSTRVVAAVATSVAVTYHVLYERGGASAVDDLPNGRRWRTAVENGPDDERHLRIHAGHQVELNEYDELLFPEAGQLAATLTNVASSAVLRERLTDWSARGVSEVVYQPAGPDLARELTAFAAMADGL